MIDHIVGLPEARLRRRISTVGFARETALVVLLGALGSIGIAYVSWKMLSGVENQPSYFELTLIGQSLVPSLVLFAFWIWYALCGHFLAKLYNGGRPFDRTFRAAAWALVPVGMWYLLRSIVIVVLFFGLEVPAEPEGVEAEEQIAHVMALGLENTIYVGILLLGLVFSIWSWYLLSIGIAEAKEISLENAKKVAVVPSGTFALYVIHLVLQWQGIL